MAALHARKGDVQALKVDAAAHLYGKKLNFTAAASVNDVISKGSNPFATNTILFSSGELQLSEPSAAATFLGELHTSKAHFGKQGARMIRGTCRSVGGESGPARTCTRVHGLCRGWSQPPHACDTRCAGTSGTSHFPPPTEHPPTTFLPHPATPPRPLTTISPVPFPLTPPQPAAAPRCPCPC